MAEVGVAADRHRVFRLVLLQFVEYAPGHPRREFLGRQAIAPAHDARKRAELVRAGGVCFADRRDYILVERLAVCSRLLGPVQHGDAFRGRRNDLEQLVRRERAEQPHFHHAHLFAMMIDVVDHFFHRFSAGTHQHDHAIGILRAGIFIYVVLSSGQPGKLVHGSLHDPGHALVKWIDRLARLEIHVRVLRSAAYERMVRRQRACPVREHQLVVYHFPHHFGRHLLDLGDFVRSAETVKEMQDRHARFQRCRLGDQRHIHRLLHRIGGETGKAGRACRHHVAMVAENRQALGGQRTRCDVHHEGRELSGDLVHIGDHQQQALRCGKGGRQRAGLQRAVYRAGRAALALHLDDFRNRTPEIPDALGRPCIGIFAHRRRRGDRINRDHFVGHVGDIGGGFVAVDRNHARL